MAKKAVELAPGEDELWYLLGVAQYRAGNWRDAVAALEQSRALGSAGGDDLEFYLAMAYGRLGDKTQADTWYKKAVQLMNQHKNDLEKWPQYLQELNRIRTEAATILGVKEEKK